jgi:hypothetical protein
MVAEKGKIFISLFFLQVMIIVVTVIVMCK